MSLKPLTFSLYEDLVASHEEIGLLEVLLGAARGIALDADELAILVRQMGRHWEVLNRALRFMDGRDDPADQEEPAPDPEPAPAPTVPPLTEQQMCLVGLLKASFDAKDHGEGQPHD